MGAPLGEETKELLFTEILNDISDEGMSLRKALKGRMSSKTFFEYVDADEERIKRYTRACEDRAEAIVDKIIEIADETSNDTIIIEKRGEGIEVENKEWVNRSRLRVDTYKWILSKQYPKKYGDRVVTEVTGKDGKDLNTSPAIILFKDYKNEQ